jgi:hypothetical protein
VMLIHIIYIIFILIEKQEKFALRIAVVLVL